MSKIIAPMIVAISNRLIPHFIYSSIIVFSSLFHFFYWQYLNPVLSYSFLNLLSFIPNPFSFILAFVIIIANSSIFRCFHLIFIRLIEVLINLIILSSDIH